MNEELENVTEEVSEVESANVKQQFTTVTTFSKYLALALFITLPFIGGWIGYHYAPEKVAEVEKVVIQEVEHKDLSNGLDTETLKVSDKSASESMAAGEIVLPNGSSLENYISNHQYLKYFKKRDSGELEETVDLSQGANGELKSIGFGCEKDDKYYYQDGMIVTETSYAIPAGEYSGHFANDGSSVYVLRGPCYKTNFDSNTFEDLGSLYSKDKNGLYKVTYKSIDKVIGVDVSSARPLDSDWLIDKNNVYFRSSVMKDIDIETFESVGAFYKDKANIYYDNVGARATEPKNISGPDPETFGYIENVYYYDKDYVYISYYENLKVIDGVAVESFEYLGTCGCVEKSCGYYIKDANGVYCGSEKMEADPNSFEYLGNYNANPGGMPMVDGVAKDGKCVYLGNKKVLDESNQCVTPELCSADDEFVNCGIE